MAYEAGRPKYLWRVIRACGPPAAHPRAKKPVNFRKYCSRQRGRRLFREDPGLQGLEEVRDTLISKGWLFF